MFKFLNAANPTTNTTTLAAGNIMTTLSQLLPFILIAVVFYFFIIRPQNKQRQQLNVMINNLKKVDKVITKGGIIGTIWEVLETTFVIQVQDGTKIEILKNSVIALMNDKK